jgi:hypothetical protein
VVGFLALPDRQVNIHYRWGNPTVSGNMGGGKYRRPGRRRISIWIMFLILIVLIYMVKSAYDQVQRESLFVYLSSISSIDREFNDEEALAIFRYNSNIKIFGKAAIPDIEAAIVSANKSLTSLQKIEVPSVHGMQKPLDLYVQHQQQYEYRKQRLDVLKMQLSSPKVNYSNEINRYNSLVSEQFQKSRSLMIQLCIESDLKYKVLADGGLFFEVITHNPLISSFKRFTN